MANIFDVAKYIIQTNGACGSLKLQKLCYYCQAWHLAWTGEPLFKDKFIKWNTGPVCKELMILNENNLPIFTYNSKTPLNGDPNNLSEDEKDSINIVLESYGKNSAYELSSLSLEEDPCLKAHVGEEISLKNMQNYYSSLLV